MLLYFDRWVGLSVTIAEVACVVSVRFYGELTILASYRHWLGLRVNDIGELTILDRSAS